MLMKRVFCLYRVSTLGQVEKDDIPMQKQSCHEFVSKNPDWKITGEFSEKGVSGFKVSAKDRDAIQSLQKAAAEKEFDVLLVFMFDRIGRKEDETPFIVEWFVQNGIEVWSVNEGQQRFENHVDKLLNYIRYWQASGESVKTSIRTKTRMGQLVRDGYFKGGVAPFGYRLVHKGRINKRGHEVYDLEIDEAEAAIVRLIFDKHSYLGMGPQTIAATLTSKGVLNRAGNNFVSPTIRSIVGNPMYRGVLRCGESVSEPFEHLRIIDDETFFRSQDYIKQRSVKYQEERRIPRKIPKSCLLTGNIFCGHCGARLITSTAGKTRVRKDGSVYKRRYWRYLCYNQMRHKGTCCGQTGYTATRIDEAVTTIVSELLAGLKKVSVAAIIEKRQGVELKNLRSEYAAAQKTLQKKVNSIEALKAEVVKAVSGESSFRPELLSGMIEAAEGEKERVEQIVAQALERLATSNNMVESFKEQHDRYVSWADIFDECEPSVKTLIICQLIDRINVSRGYEISVQLNVTMAQYLELAECKVQLSA